MELNYSDIQARQLLEQTYVPTQHISLAIYAPGSTPLLDASLRCQLHGNFFRITHPEEVTTRSCAAVVVAAEDVQLMSTALMQYAAALLDGHDFADADTLFSGEIPVLSVATLPVAVMTAELFLRAAGETHAPRSILRRADAMAQSRKHFPWALVQCPQKGKYTAPFCAGKKRALLLSHEYSLTGAPLVLTSMVPVLRELGYGVVVTAPVWGDAAPLFAAMGADVLICSEQLENPTLFQLALSCDLVLANTVVEVEAVQKLSGTNVNTLWWLHDAHSVYPDIIHRIPKTLEKNIRIFSVGHIARAAMNAYRPEFSIGQLLYGLSDLTREPRSDRSFVREGRLLFISVGTVEQRKGQDILVRAIKELSPGELKKAHFLFVGKPRHPKVFREVELLCLKHPESVSHIPFLTRDDIKALMDQCDCVVCPSRDDPMPTFVTEGAMFGKPAIVSEYTGTASLIRQGENGFVYHRNSPTALARLLKEVIQNPEKLARMAPACRAFYEAHFTREAFRNAVTDILKTL